MSERDWPTWSAKKGASLTFDGMTLDEVFSRIHSQIEILKARPIFKPSISGPTQPLALAPTPASAPVPAAVSLKGPSKEKDEITDMLKIHIKEIKDDLSGLKSRINLFENRASNFVAPHIERVEPVESIIAVQPDAESIAKDITENFQQQLQLFQETLSKSFDETNKCLRDQIKVLEERFAESDRRNQEFEKRMMTTLEELRSAQSKDITLLDQKLSTQISGIELKLKALEEKIDYVQEYAVSFEGRVKNVVLHASKQAEKIDSLMDNKAATDQRILSQDTLISHANREVEFLKSKMEALLGECDARIMHEFKRLDAVKVNREELDKKTDVQLTMTKADSSEIERLEDVILELGRRTTQHARESAEAMGNMGRNYDQKLEAIGAWCLQLMNREKKAQADGENANIGKIKCLVCDQVVKQNPDQDVVFSGPGMINTLQKMKAFPRPVNQPRQRGVSPPSARPVPITSDNPLISTPQIVSKLARMGAVLHSTSTPALEPNLDDDDHLLADPARDTDDTNNGDTGAAAATSPSGVAIVGQHAKSVAGIAGQRDGAPIGPAADQPFPTMSLAAGSPLLGSPQEREYVTTFRATVQHSESQPYFKDLETKFAGTGGRRGGPAYRPNSAPMKRAQAGRLQAIGRPVDFR